MLVSLMILHNIFLIKVSSEIIQVNFPERSNHLTIGCHYHFFPNKEKINNEKNHDLKKFSEPLAYEQ